MSMGNAVLMGSVRVCRGGQVRVMEVLVRSVLLGSSRILRGTVKVRFFFCHWVVPC